MIEKKGPETSVNFQQEICYEDVLTYIRHENDVFIRTNRQKLTLWLIYLHEKLPFAQDVQDFIANSILLDKLISSTSSCYFFKSSFPMGEEMQRLLASLIINK